MKKEKNNGMRIYTVAVTVVALGLLVFCVSLLMVNGSLKKDVLVLKSQVRKFRAESVAIPFDDADWDPGRFYGFGWQNNARQGRNARIEKTGAGE
jgi:hypothetical protein